MASSANTSVNHPYIPSTDSELAEMLEVIGVDSLDGLLGDIPIEHRHPKLDIDAGLSEQELSTVFG